MPKAKNIVKDFDFFIDNLVEEKGLDNLDPEVLEQVKKDLADRLEDRINVVILKNMPLDKLEDFEKKLESASDEELQGFCKENIVNLEEVVAAELLAFRQTYLS